MNSVALSESRRLAGIAREYEERGYGVKCRPATGDLPEFLADLHPDLIAMGNGESVAIAVKTRAELKDPQTLAALEAAVSDQPGWRFELVIDGSELAGRRPLSGSQLEAYLVEANELQQHGHMTAALLLLWSATEGILRLLALREDVEVESTAAAYLPKRLYSLGLLKRDQYWTLDAAMRLRNQAAHGFEVEVSRQDLAPIAAVARDLLGELNSKAA